MDKLTTVFSRNRRFSQRHNVKTALRVRVWKSRLPEERAESVNLSQRGIFFASDSRLAEGEVVEILLKMPEEISGQPTTEWRCTGRVVRVEPDDSFEGKFGVGVQFYC
jgi:PilZ domain